MTQVERSNKIISAFVVCSDIIVIDLIFVVFHYFWAQYQTPIITGSIFPMLLTLTLSYVISSSFSGVILYFRRVRPDQIIHKTAKDLILFLLVWILISSIFSVVPIFNGALAIYFVTTAIIALSLRLIFFFLLRIQRKRGKNRCNVVYVGSGSNLMELYNEMAQQLDTGYNVMGYFDNAPNPTFDEKCPYLGSSEDVVGYLNRGGIDRVYCGLPSRDSEIILPIINHCEGHLIRFFSVPNFRNYCHRRVSLEMFSNVPLLTIREEPLNLSSNRFFKRTFDLLFSTLFLCTAFLPIYVVVGIITKITSPGPIFFKQKRDRKSVV